MKIHLCFALIGAFFAPVLCQAQDINAQVVMNDLLSKKPKLVTTKTEQKCVWRDSKGKLLDTAICGDRRVESIEQARAVDSFIVEVTALTFNKEKMVALPEKAHLAQLRRFNCSPGSLNSAISLSVSGTQSWSVQKSQSVTTTVGHSVSGNFSIGKIGSLNMGMTWSGAIQTSSGTQEGTSQTVSRSLSDTIGIPPRKAVVISLLAYEPTMELPYEATLVVDGALADNMAGFKLASQLLTKAERTFPIRGVLRLTDVSESVVRVEELKGDAGCANAATDIATAEETSSRSVDAKSLAPKFVSLFKKSVSLTRGQPMSTKVQGGGLRTFGAVLPQSSDDVIGPPNGIHYTVQSTVEVMEPAIQCGFNDIGIANPGLFNLETREYSNYMDGKLVAVWTEQVKTFTKCWVF